MFSRFRSLGRSAGRLLRTLILALLAAVAGCDRKPQWRGVGTHVGGARAGPTPDPPHGGHSRPRPPIPLPGATAMAMPAEPRGGRCLIALLLAALIALTALAILVAH